MKSSITDLKRSRTIKKYPAITIKDDKTKVYCGDNSIKEYEERERQIYLNKIRAS